ncbi:uncharacterized protein LOC132204343 isoform X2 [Neocloeon triangulifer]|uniref:uncharacterized protein LOC132204343 isoform X2 n=1 Tax=Neocloeon triangulifer TaxID=2078957 RepID=UPI00286F1DF9|nr:uncharacterized protein LOC132204343 isoform X2 [Neocloeon triangulifer]
MNYYFYFILIIVLHSTKLFDISQAQKRKDGRGKAKYNRNSARHKVIRCCGAQSCTQFSAIFKATTAITNGSASSASTMTLRVTNVQVTLSETQSSEISDAPVQSVETTTAIINEITSALSSSEQNLPAVSDSTTETTVTIQSETPVSSILPDPITKMQADETTLSTFAQVESTTNLNSLQHSSLAAPEASQKNVPSSSSTSNLQTIMGTTNGTIAGTTEIIGGSTTGKIAGTTTAITDMKTIIFIKPTAAPTKAPEIYPKCPTSCQRDASLLDLDMSIRDPFAHGFWRTTCGSLFVFGKTLANWQQNFDKCCSLGMVPIFFEARDKFMCFNRMINGFNWPYNTRYWTSGLRDSPSRFVFCQTTANVSSYYWESGEPNNVNKSENCAQLIIKPGNNTALLADKYCGEISAFACMGPTTPKPACSAPQCPNITCTSNSNFFSNNSSPVAINYLKNPSMHGQWFSTQGRYYVFSYPNDTRSAQFWTSGTDLGCEGSFGYCSSNRLLRREARWGLGQPDDLTKSQNCLAIYVNMTDSLLSDEDCNLKMRYICQGKSPRTIETIQKECADLYSLTAGQVSRLRNDSAKNVAEKCFLKCFGEETGFMKDGDLVQEKILAQFQSLSQGNVDKLSESYSTFDYCTHVTKGMDDCDRASALMKCGQVNSPELISSLLDNLENTFKDGSVDDAVVMLPNQSSTCPIHKCVVDVDLKATFDGAPANSSFKSIYGTGKVAEACGKRLLGLIMPLSMAINKSSFPEAFAICCKFGLRLFMFDTTTKQTCLRTQVYLMDYPTGVSGYLIAAYYIDPSVNKTAITCPSRQLVMQQKEIVEQNTNAQGFFLTIKTFSGIFFPYRNPSSEKILCESN